MMVVRGLLAMLFGIAILAWPHVSLLTIVVLFGGYATLDGGRPYLERPAASGKSPTCRTPP
jgi:uncharacterized membrane protein HdeD (DUF308 family)